VRTEAWSEYALLIAREKLTLLYDDALAMIDENEAKAVLPVEQFRSYAARALISDARGEQQRAEAYARKALRSSELTHSGFTSHPKLGLVEAEYEPLKVILRDLASEYLV
jgi:hypothetical protein